MKVDVGRMSPKTRRQLDEHWRQQESALDRMSGTDTDRLAWLVEQLVNPERPRLSAAKQVELGYDLRQLVPQIGMGWRQPLEPLPERTFRHIHRATQRYLRALVRDATPYEDLSRDRKAGWPLPLTPMRLVRANPFGGRFVILPDARSEQAKILWGIAELLRRVGHRLKGCKGCPNLFVVRKRQRQEYCMPKCSMRVRNQRRARSRRKG